ncbi:hypothetical protein LTR32_002551 [Rachicladosporium monterosium]|uniref:Meiotically up-regulated 157 protein n=1 Tax=Rachicladosporium monterosium TaxID=1507873 RepID=A0ABR0L9Y8_9PEZI|nr:hypothetical protein LTR32_002551 [Rachicladosporium monterosium]
MRAPSTAALLVLASLCFETSFCHAKAEQDAAKAKAKYQAACPAYEHYVRFPHNPLSDGPMRLPYQRPSPHCRTFESDLVEKIIRDMNATMMDRDLARIFENAFPNTLDTTVRWHTDGTATKTDKMAQQVLGNSKWAADGAWKGPQSFIVTGDINAEWLRDSTNQLAQYQPLAKNDKAISNLILGAINTQAEYVIASPYCNAFQPPPPSKLRATDNGQADSTTGEFQRQMYRFQRQTTTGTETLNLAGNGNPLNYGTGLVRSAFRPSDDATILGFFIPANAMMAVELKRTASVLQFVGSKPKLAADLKSRGEVIEKGIWTHAVVNHAIHGPVFAFEIDGYGSHIIMDDANVPSLLSLPYLGFVNKTERTYQNTRRMILSKDSNPYFLTGSAFSGIGGPHIGLQNAWPMSLLMQVLTASDDEQGAEEMKRCLERVRDSCLLGVVHESVNVGKIGEYSRSWFAWANSVLAQAVLDVAERRPELLFGKGAKAYRVGE